MYPKRSLTSNILCTGLLSYTSWFNAACERFNYWAIWKQCGCGKVKFRKVNFRNFRNTSQETKMKKNKFNSNRSVIFKLLCWTMSPQKNNTNAWLLTTINEEFRLLLSFSCCSCSVVWSIRITGKSPVEYLTSLNTGLMMFIFKYIEQQSFIILPFHFELKYLSWISRDNLIHSFMS